MPDRATPCFAKLNSSISTALHVALARWLLTQMRPPFCDAKRWNTERRASKAAFQCSGAPLQLRPRKRYSHVPPPFANGTPMERTLATTQDEAPRPASLGITIFIRL